MRTHARTQGRTSPQHITLADLCRAIDDRQIPVTREHDDFIVTQRDLLRWLGDRETRLQSGTRQRPAS